MIHTTAAPSKFPTPDDLFGPPALPRHSRRQRIAAKPVVYLSDADRAYLEHYDAAEDYPAHVADAVQAIFDARGTSPVVVIEAGPVACAVGDPGPLFAGPVATRTPQRRRIARRVAA